MAEYIEKEALMQAYYKIRPELGTRVIEWTNILENFPTADVQPVKCGKWETGYICSNCHESADYFVSGDVWIDKMPNYCPNCGYDMEATENVNP